MAPPTMMSLAWESELRFYKIDVVRKDRDENAEDVHKPRQGDSERQTP